MPRSPHPKLQAASKKCSPSIQPRPRPLAYAGGRFAGLPHRLRVASGVISLMVGLALAYQVGVVGGLFGANPSWTPR